MRFLLTSAGIKNASIRDTLVDLLGKPMVESRRLPAFPTAAYGQRPRSVPALGHGWDISDDEKIRTPMCELGLRRLEAADRWRQNAGNRRLSICPHLAHEDMPGNSMAEAERWAAGSQIRRMRLTIRPPSK